MNNSKQTSQNKNDAQQQEALKDLERLESTSEVFGTSNLARAGRKAQEHLTARDQDQSDRIEVWGTRIGRFLAVIAVIYLVYRLLNKYLL